MESAEETRKDVLSPTPQIVAPQNQQNTTTQNAVMQNPVVQNLVTQNPVMQNSVAQSPVNQPQDAKEDTPAEKVPIEKKVESEGEDTKLVRYNMCKYCQGIINKKATSQVKFCSKSCAEMFKMVPPDISAETGKIETKLSFTKREKDWKYYKELLRERSPPPPTFSQITEPAPGLEPGMKLEVLDILNPQNYCVATVTKIMGHRLCIRYDGFGDDATSDIWFNFQAEELYPIGWCASHGYSLQPPTGITSTAQEWKAFLAKTLCGALAAPSTLFKKSQIRRQLRCHSYCSGDRLEVIHPKAPHLVCPATVTKSLGPYYFFVTTDLLPGVPSHTFYGYADCPGVYHTGWCEKFGLFLDMSDPKDIKMGKLPGKPFIQTDYSNSARKNRPGLFRVPQKVEALDGEDFRVGTVAEIFGRLNMLVFDGTGQVKFFDKNSTDVFPIGWCERTESILVTPYGKVNFMSPALQKKRSSIVIQSASFKSVQNQNEKELVSPKEVASPYDSQKDDLSDGSVDGGDTDFDMSLSPNTDQQKNEMERFVVWLLNHYQYNKNEAVCAVKQELVEKFINLSNLKLSPKWFALIYKLFPGVQTVRRCVEGKFVEDGICSVSSSKDDTILANLRFYFNKTCYAGVLLDPARVSQLPIKSHEEKPAQALKELIQKLMDISTDQLKFIDLLEFAFGSRIYDRGSAKIVKKGLFRFNTRNKVRKFLKRLNKRLQCCKYFIGIDLTPCKSKCKGNNITLTHSSGISLAEKLRSQLATTSAPMAQSMPANISSSYPVSISPQYQHLRKSPKKPPIYQPKIQQQPPLYLQQSQQQHQQQPQSPNVIRPSSNMQLLYQLPPSKPNSSNPQIIVQTPEGNRFSQPTQFLLPPNITSTSTSVTYMVVTKENVVQNIHVPISTQSAINAQSNAHVTHVTPNSFSSPSSGVTQMMANVAKTSLMTDIDDPNRTGKTSITIVKGNGPSNQKIFIKKPEQLYVRDNSNINKPVSISLNSPLNKSPNYIENNSQMHYPKIQYVKSLNENHSQQPTDLKRPVVQTADKNQQKHVHKLHHGNARVKYVEFKPLQNQVDNPGYKPQHLKQTIYYPSHLPGPQNTPNSQNLTIHTPVSNQNLPQQSPPALRPPPPVRPRTLALNSPPSLVASPELRPRFNFAGQPVNSTPISQISSHPVGKGNVNYKVTLGDGSLKPSRVIYQQGMSQNQNIVKPGETIQLGEQMDNRAKSNTASAQGSTAVTVTMAYIPIQTQSKDKYVYVPVNSLQPGTPNGQQILFYPQNQQVKDPNGKPVILSPQFVPTNNKPLVSTPKPDKEDNTANPYTTVRIQGVPQPGSNITNKPNTPLNLQPKTYKYQFTGTIGGMNPTLQETSRKYPEAFRMIKNDNNYRDAIKDPNDMLKAEKLEEIKEALSKELRAKENSISEKSKTENELVNDDNAKDNDEVFLHKNADKQEKEEVVEKSNENEENITPPPPRKRKRRGRPPSSSKSPDKDNARSKLSIIQENPLPPSTQGNPITLANRVLTETFYNKQKEIQKRTRFIEDPLTKCPDLPKNPENWTQDHVHAFMRGTDLAQYADTLKEEEVDGRSFLLLTREALMEFTGMRLGPALKISGYAAGLRARQRMFGIDCALYNGDDQGQSQTKTRKRSLSEKKSIKNNTIGTTKKQTKLGNRTKVDNEIKQEITYNDGESNLIKNNPVVPMDVE